MYSTERMMVFLCFNACFVSTLLLVIDGETAVFNVEVHVFYHSERPIVIFTHNNSIWRKYQYRERK